MGVVQPLGDPAMHFWLTRSVARAMGLSLSEAMAEGRMSSEEYAQMVTRCRTCPAVAACQAWLGAQTGRAMQAPDCCMHAALLEGLAARG